MPEITRPWIIDDLDKLRRKQNPNRWDDTTDPRPHAPNPVPYDINDDPTQSPRRQIDERMPGIDKPEIGDVDDDEDKTDIIEERWPTEEIPKRPVRTPTEDIYRRKNPDGDRGITRIDNGIDNSDDPTEENIIDSRI